MQMHHYVLQTRSLIFDVHEMLNQTHNSETYRFLTNIMHEIHAAALLWFSRRW